MSNALHPAEPTQTPRQGVVARCLRRLGGAVRGALAGIALIPRRRPAAPQPRRTRPAPADQAAPARKPRQPRAQRRPRTAAASLPPAGAARPGWFARWFGRTQRRTAALDPPQTAESDDAPFTPETHPHFSTAACEFLNTPVEDCDPELLRLVLAIFARNLAEELPPELGLDPRALFASLCDRLGAADTATAPPAPPIPPNAVQPASPEQVPPRTEQPASPEPALQMEPAAPADAAAIAATRNTTQDARSPAGPRARTPRPPFARGRPFRQRTLLPRCRSPSRRRLPGRSRSPPPRRLCYAACAGPP